MSSINNNTPPLDSNAIGTIGPATTRKPDLGTQNISGKSKVSDSQVDTSAADEELSTRTKKLGNEDVSDAYAVGRAVEMPMPPGASDSTPTLPIHKIANPVAANKEAMAALQRLSAAAPIVSQGISESTIFAILMEATNKQLQAQSNAQALSQRASLNAQAAAAADALKKAQSEQKAAVTTFATNLGASATTYKMARMGSSTGEANQVQKELAASSKIKPAEPKMSQEKMAAKKAETRDNDARSDMSDYIVKASDQKATVKKKDKEKELTERAEQPLATEHSTKIDDVVEATSSTDAGKAAAHRAGMYAAASGAGQLVTSGGDAINQNIGFGADAKQAEVAMKYDDLQKTVADQQAEVAKSNKERATKMVDSAIDALKQHFDMVKATNDRIGQ